MKEIPLTKGCVAIVDDADYETLAAHRWLACNRRGVPVYAGRDVGGRRLLMHRVILAAPSGFEVDHINGDGFDNRRQNLRLATRSQNARNIGSRRGASSQYVGVSYDRRSGRWASQISVNYKNHHLGYFDNEREAALAYDRAARAMHGAFARPNFQE